MKSRKKIIISIALLAAANITVLAVLGFVLSGIKKERQIIGQIRQNIETADKKLVSARSLSGLLKDVEKETGKISAVFLNSRNIVKFIEELEFLNRKADTTLVIKIAKLPGPTENEKPQFQFQVQGAFRDIFHYFSLLENLPYQMSVEKFYLTRPEGVKSKWQADFEITLLSYENN